MEINESILLCSLVLLVVGAKETRIQVEGTATEKDNTYIQQGNCEWERTLDDHNLSHLDQVTDEDIEEGDEENMDRSLLGFDHFDHSELKTNDAVKPRCPEAEEAVLPTYEYPALTRRYPGKVGDTQEVEYSPGKILKLITRAVQPPIFEIPAFLTPEECDSIIQISMNVGFKRSRVYGTNIDEDFKTKNVADVSRVSDEATLKMAELGDLGASLINRVASITQLPIEVIERSEELQVVSYKEGGHFHAHLDSSNSFKEEEAPSHIPCCFQMNKCGDVAETPNWETCCRLCRYMTVLYYLSDVPEGGETAFPLADLPEDNYQDTLKGKDFRWCNLSYYCYNASFILRPKKGTAIMWYNHHVDPETGYLGPSDNHSYHGGCDVLKGSKWVANTWISTPPYLDRLKPSRYYTGK